MANQKIFNPLDAAKELTENIMKDVEGRLVAIEPAIEQAIWVRFVRRVVHVSLAELVQSDPKQTEIYSEMLALADKL